MSDPSADRTDFGIEWTRKGRVMVGTPWVIYGKNPPQDLFHKLIVPLELWPEYREFLTSLGAVLDDVGLIDGAHALVDESPAVSLITQPVGGSGCMAIRRKKHG